MIFRDVTATVGRTPVVELGRLAKGLPGRVVAKLEMRNPLHRLRVRLKDCIETNKVPQNPQFGDNL